MKKFLAFILCSLLMPAGAFAENWRVFDNCGLLAPAEIEIVESAITDFHRNTGIDFVILVTDDYLGKQLTYELAEFTYTNGPFGFGQKQEGILYHVDRANVLNCFFIKGQAALTLGQDGEIAIHQAAQEYYDNGDYLQAFLSVISTARKLLSE